MSSSPADAENLTVHGLTEDQKHDAIARIVGFQPYRQISRWPDEICPVVVGFKPEYADRIDGDLEKWAKSLGLSVVHNCQENNVVIIGTDDSAGVVKQLLNKSPDLWQGYEANPAFADNFRPPDNETLRHLHSRLPVKWFSATSIEPGGGNYARRFAGVAGGAPVVSTWDITALGTVMVSVNRLVVVIIDTSLAHGAPLDSLSDYVSLIVLSRPRMEERYPDQSILSLFNGSVVNVSAPPAMTLLDRSVLESLYHANLAEEPWDELGQIEENVRGW